MVSGPNVDSPPLQLEDLANELRRIRGMLDDHERRMFPVDRSNLPQPTGQLDGEQPGQSWTVSKWVVALPDDEAERGGCVYIHTPHSMRGAGLGDLGDLVAVPYHEARVFAASILAAVAHGEGSVRRIKPKRKT